MRKLISLLLGICIISTLMPIVSATTTYEKIFDMDLSAAVYGDVSTDLDGDPDTADVTIKNVTGITNKVVGTTTLIQGEGHSTTAQHRPELITEGDIKYLRFAKLTTDGTTNTVANTASGLHVEFAKDDYLEENSLIFEVWARTNNKHNDTNESDVISDARYGEMFSFSKVSNTAPVFYNSGSDENAIAARFEYSKLQFKTKGNGVSYGTLMEDASAYEDKWTHYVMVRENDASSNKYTAKLYINGEFSNSFENTNATAEDYESENGWNDLIIGASARNQNRAFHGDIAEFRVYTGTITNNEIKAAYKSTRGKYMETAKVTSNTLDRITRENIRFDVTFDEAMDIRTITKDNVYIEAENGTRIAVKDTIVKEGNTVSFELSRYLGYNTTYYLNLVDVISESEKPLDNERIEFRTVGKDGIKISKLTPEISSSVATISTTIEGEANTEMILVMVIYNETGQVIGLISKKEKIGDAGMKEYTVSTENADIILPSKYKIKAIAYSLDSEKGAIAFSAPIEISK